MLCSRDLVSYPGGGGEGGVCESAGPEADLIGMVAAVVVPFAMFLGGGGGAVVGGERTMTGFGLFPRPERRVGEDGRIELEVVGCEYATGS